MLHRIHEWILPLMAAVSADKKSNSPPLTEENLSQHNKDISSGRLKIPEQPDEVIS